MKAATLDHRRKFVLFMLIAGLLSLLGRAVQLQYFDREFLQGKGDARHLRIAKIPAHRGMITDRMGEPLAISSPVESIWANPQEAILDRKGLTKTAGLLGLDGNKLHHHLTARSGQGFVYLRRHVNPDLARRVMALKAQGINLQREYHRYYPMGEVTAHVLGITNVDDRGLEGIELAYNQWLMGEPGSKRVLRDRLGRVIDDIEQIRESRPGQDLKLSLDRRIQYLAYRELKSAVHKHSASSGSLVVLDARRGKVLAMVSQPSFNPNNRRSRNNVLARNCTVTDVFEPGSTIKPFIVAAALEQGQFNPQSTIDTSPGWYMVRGHTIQDEHDYGEITLAKVISKSSNVGASKIALAILPEDLWKTLADVGFGAATGSGFPGETSGLLRDYSHWREVERATLAFGYGLSATALQLAQAYAVLANDGLYRQISFLENETPKEAARVLSTTTIQQVRGMLEEVMSDEGTGVSARVPGYRVAGKTGTVHKSTAQGYAKDRYMSMFAGFAPVTDPWLVMVIVINEPSKGEYFGGVVAAPVFSKVMAGALRLLDVPPDDLPATEQVLAGAERNSG